MGKNGALDPRGVEVAHGAMPDATGDRRIERNMETLCSPVRVKILRALKASDLAAGDLALVIGRSASTTSQHLRVLREAGVVMAQRTGNVVRYRLAPGVTSDLLAQLAMRLDAA